MSETEKAFSKEKRRVYNSVYYLRYDLKQVLYQSLLKYVILYRHREDILDKQVKERAQSVKSTSAHLIH